MSNGGLDRHLDAEHAAELAGRVAGRRLDLRYVGAPVGQDAAGGRSRTHTPSSTTFTPSDGPAMVIPS